jgi:hypothetical protein
MSICQSPPQTAPNEQVHQACVSPVSKYSGDRNELRPCLWVDATAVISCHPYRLWRRFAVGLGTQQIVSMLGLFHMRCRNTRKDNRQLLFLHGRIQSLLPRQSDAHVIIKPVPHGVSSEDPLKDAYPLQLSE